MENKFIKGLILGGFLVFAATVGFVISKEGRVCTKKIKENFKPVAKQIKENINRLHDVAKDDFDELVAVMVEDYAKKKELSDDYKKTLTSALKSKWDEVRIKFESDRLI